ncbi:ribonuclease H-like domain-containing protein [Tanacetum coccineum]
MGRVTSQRAVRPVWNNAQRVNHQIKLTHLHLKRNFVPTAVATNFRLVPVNAAKQSSPRATTSISIGRPVNTTESKPRVNSASLIKYSYFKAHSPLRRTFNQKSAVKTNNFNKKAYTVKLNNVTTAGQEVVDQGIFDKSPKGGKITGKGKIRTGKLDFKDVYFVKELKFNIFSISQMCDKKNSVLFTETECLVLSPDFKLLNESQVLLKVPRQNNMYSFDLKNVVPSEGETLLEAYLQSFLKMTILVLLVRRESNTKPLNRVLVTKPHNKTPYELLLGKPPSISFMRPFGCLVTILNTLDPLGKFDGKADEGFFVGYFINSKAFRVFNTRTRKVEENLHINFIENKPSVAGSGPEWLFDIDSLTKSMNYEPVAAGNQTNGDAGIETNVNAGQAGQEKASDHEYILLPLMLSNSPLFSNTQSTDDKDADEVPDKGDDDVSQRNGQEKEGGASNKEVDQHVQDFKAELDSLLVQQKEGYANSTNRDSTASSSVSTAWLSINTASENINTGSPNINIASYIPNDSSMQYLENTGIFDDAHDDREVGVKADLNNLETIMNVSLIPTTRIHKDHPKDQIIGDINSATQTRRMNKISKEHAMVWTLVDLPKSKRAIGTKWVYRNKKYKRGIVVRNKARMVAQVKTASTPIETNKALLKDEEAEDVDVYLYRLMIGSLMYLTASRPDIMFAVCACARILSISWQKVLWIQNQMLDYGFNFMNTEIYIDNESPIYIVKNLVFHSKTKHIEIRHHFIRDSYEKKLIQVIKIHTNYNVTDLLTKASDSKKPKKAKRTTEISQSSGPIHLVADETVYKEWEDRMERAATTASSLEAEQDSGNINRTQSMATLNESFPQGTDSCSSPRCQDTILGGAEAHIRFEVASIQSNDLPLSRVNTLGSGKTT